MRAKENSLSSAAIKALIKDINLAISKNDHSVAREIIKKAVEGYEPPNH